MTTLRAFARRDFLIARSYRFAVVIEAFVGLVNLLVYFFISRTFGDMAPATLGSAPSYFAFAAVGAAMATVINAATAATALNLRQEQLTGTLEATATQPVSPVALAAGMSGLPFVMATLRAAAYIAIAALLLDLDLSEADPGGAAAVLVVSGVALSSLGIGSAAMIMVVKRGDILAGFGAFAIGLVSGAFFPLSVLPGWLESIGKVLPTRFCFDGLRASLFGGEWTNDVLVLTLYALALLPIAVFAFAAAFRAAKRAGSIAEY